MPIGSDPQATTPVVLKIDKSTNPTPTFQVRFLTAREMRRAEALLRDARALDKAGEADEANAGKCDAKLDELFGLSIAGWSDVTFKGQPVEHGKNSPLDFLSDFELWELASECVYAPRVAERDRRNLASPSGPDTANVATAPAASATTPTASQAQPNPSA